MAVIGRVEIRFDRSREAAAQMREAPVAGGGCGIRWTM